MGKQDELWYVIDGEGKILTPMGYPLIWNYNGGMAKVIDEKGVGYLNKNGEKVMPGKYLESKKFTDGMAAVKLYPKRR